MPWQNTPEHRAHTSRTYNAEYKRNRITCLRNAKWRCQIRLAGCIGSASQCDHVVPVSAGGTNDLDNLRAACVACHAKVTADQGGGWRRTGNRQRQQTDPNPRPATDWNK